MLPTAQATQFFERVEVPVAVKQGIVMFNAKRSNQYVNGASYRHPLLTQAAVVLRRCQHSFSTSDGLNAERLHQQARLPVVALVSEAPQNLKQHQVRHDQPDLAVSEQVVKQLGCGPIRVIEEVDPDT